MKEARSFISIFLSNYEKINIPQVGRATQSSQKDSNFRLEEKLRDTNNWRSELQSELDAVLGETELLMETRWTLFDLPDRPDQSSSSGTNCYHPLIRPNGLSG